MLLGAQTVSVIGFALVFPFLPLYVAEVGVSTRGSVELWAGMAYTSQAVAMFVMAPIWGSLADRFGRKLMIQRALFGGAIALAAMGFVRNAEELALLRFIQGGITGVIPASNALVAATVPRERSGWALGLMQTSVWTGTSVGPLIGGVLADTIGFRGTFVTTGALLFLTGIAVWRLASEEGAEVEAEDEAGGRRGARMLRAWRRALEGQTVRAAYSVKFMVRLGATMILPIAPLLVAHLAPTAGNVATLAGVFTAVTSLAGILTASWFGSLGDRIGHRPVLIFGCAASALAYFPFLWVDSVTQLIVLAVGIGIASGAVMPGIGAILARAAPTGGQGTVYGIDASVNAAARAVAPLAGSSIAGAAGLQMGFVAAGFVYLAAAGVAARTLERPDAGSG